MVPPGPPGTLHLVVGLIGIPVALGCLHLYARARQKQWEDRAIRPAGGWSRLHLCQGVAGMVAGSIITVHWGASAGIAVAAMTWLACLAVLTDIATYKIPWDAIPPVAVIGLVAGLSAYTTEGLLSFLTAVVIIVLAPLVASLLARRALGMSDIRLLWAATATMSWWAGPIWLIYGLIGSCVIQSLARVAAPAMGWGRMVHRSADPAHSASDDTDALASAEAPPRGHSAATTGPGAGEQVDASVTRPARVHLADTTQPTPTHEHLDTSSRPRLRREMPFAPALVFGMVVAVVAATYTGDGACAAWTLSSTCN